MNKIFTSLIIAGSLVSAPVFAEGWERGHDGGRSHEHERHDYREGGHDRSHNNELLGLGLGAVIIGGGLCAVFCGEAPPPPPVYYAPAPRVYAPPPVYYAPPAYYAPPQTYYAPQAPVYAPYRY